MPPNRILILDKTDLVYYCPGCQFDHWVEIRPADEKPEEHFHPSWVFNGDLQRPTLEPSVKIPVNYPEPHLDYERIQCHHYIRDGQFVYEDDCVHGFAGTTVDMIDLPEIQSL